VPMPVRPVAFSLIAALACVTLVGCSARADVHAGRVADDTVTIHAPSLAMPSVNLDAGFDTRGSAGGPGEVTASAQRSAVATAVALSGIGSVVRVASVSVKAGDAVRSGQEIARLDARALDANVAVAKAGLSTARAQVAVLDDALDTVASSRSTLASKRAQINDAAAQLASTRVKVAAQLAELKALLAQVEALGAGRPPAPPGGVPTGTVPPGGTPSPGALPDPAQLRAGIATLSAALKQIDAGLARVSAGRAQLASAGARLSDARRQLRDLRRLALVGVDASKIGVQVAEYQRETAVLRSPVDGVVVRTASVGDVLAPGATVAEVRRSGDPRVTTWIAPDSVGAVQIGTAAEVRADWFSAGLGGSAVKGRVTRISTQSEYPPTSFATSEIHLTRAVGIEITVSENADPPALPPGTPVDVRFLNE